MIILFDARVLTHNIYTGVENYTNILLDSMAKTIKVTPVKPIIQNKYLSHLWLHCILPFKKGDLLFSPANIAPLYIPKNKKLVLTLHDLSFLTYKDTFSKLFRIYYSFLVPINIKRASKIITVSQSSKNEILHYFPEAKDKIEVIYHGLDPIFKQNTATKKKNQILYVGSLNKRKNFDAVIKVFEKLDTNEYLLIIVGNFSHNFNLDDETMQQLQKAKNNSNIIFKQNITKQSLVELYNESQLFIYPSFYEGFGFPILEAMSCGTPVLCSDSTSLPEVGGDAPIYTNPNDLDDMLAKTKQILSNKHLQEEMIQKGLHQSKKFTLEKMLAKHIAVFQKEMKERDEK